MARTAHLRCGVTGGMNECLMGSCVGPRPAHWLVGIGGTETRATGFQAGIPSAPPPLRKRRWRRRRGGGDLPLRTCLPQCTRRADLPRTRCGRDRTTHTTRTMFPEAV
eukprot:5968748-Prorocentrum_lima.AAC.1